MVSRYRTGTRAVSRGVPCIASLLLLAVFPTPAQALEVGGGVSAGAVLIGTEPRLAVSPHVGLSWRAESGFLIAMHEHFSILPASNDDGAGIYNHASIAAGYAAENFSFSVGPALAIYSVPACGALLCGRTVGMGGGGRAQGSFYFAGPLGVSVQAHVDWIGGRSRVLPGGIAAMIVAGPVLRWRSL